MRLNLESLAYDLPEDILKKKWAGDFDGVKRLIKKRLERPGLTSVMRDRLTVELALIDRWVRRFPYTREEAVSAMQKRVTGFTAEEFDALEDEGCMDFIYVNGVKKYISSFGGTLIRMKNDLKEREIEKESPEERSRLEENIDRMTKNGSTAWRFRVKAHLKLDDESFIPGETYTCHLPVPAACAQQNPEEIKIFPQPGGFVAPEDEMQRTVVYERTLKENEPFEVEYSYVSRLAYCDPLCDQPRVVYPNMGAPVPDDLSEQAPHILFTPYLKNLAREIAGDETDKVLLARRVYDYITKNVKYSFMRSYILIDRHAEYAALNLKGDCGIQAILFITLCRILGIPARWQSGLTVDRDETGCHDWAQFYTDRFGWLFADPSFGGSAWRSGNERRWNFYFGNLDPFRMIANRRYQTNFNPPKKFERFDPYDSQEGEIECRERGFDCTEFDEGGVTLEYERID